MDNPGTKHASKFWARIWIIDRRIEDLKVWDNQLVPMTPMKRSIEEWVVNHIHDLSIDVILDWVKIPSESEMDVQILVSGTIDGKEDYFGEWDEWVDIETAECVEIPQDYARLFNLADDLGLPNFRPDQIEDGWYWCKTTSNTKPRLRYITDQKSYLCDPSEFPMLGPEDSAIYRGVLTQYKSIKSVR